MNVVEVNELYKYYGKARGILDVSFVIPQGMIFGFIGPNGAGKSTTIRVLLSLIHPNAGQAKVFGMDCISEGNKIRQNIGYIPADVNFYDEMKVMEFLKYSSKFFRKDCRAAIIRLCEQLDVETDKKIRALSSGNKKKVAIVQALLHEPELLILDEPTAGLDPLMQNRLYDLLREENRKGTTIFFSSHVLSEVQKMCDSVAIIKEGRILKVESVESLRGNQYKTIRIEFRNEADAIGFQMPGTAGISRRDKQVEFIIDGNISQVNRTIAKYDIENLWMDDPSLEDIFLHFYEKETV
ncbi:MAG: ABC transporter ATP-binding protein [Eubacteriales bacterium]